MFTSRPIGFVSSPYKNASEVPKGLGAKHEADGVLKILPEFERGLTDIEGFSHLIVIWEFDRSPKLELREDELLGTPPSDNRPRCEHVGRASGSHSNARSHGCRGCPVQASLGWVFWTFVCHRIDPSCGNILTH